MSHLSESAGLCPNCDQAGFVGEPCPERGCQKRGYHIVPAEFVRRLEGNVPDALVGCTIAEYLIVDVLGEGGFGKVYLVLQLPLMMKAAIKLVRAQFVDDATLGVLLKKFRAEAEALGSLSHPNIVRLFKYGVHEGSPYMVMEHVSGANTLKQETRARARRGQRFTPQEASNILRQVADGLEAAHRRRIIHRDVKPENIMLQRVAGHEHLVRILDFGLAKFIEEHTDNSMAIGTPYYMAPEQLARRGVGPWTDIYALGVITFQLFTGRRPFQGLDSRAVVAQKMNPAYDPGTVLSDLAYPPILLDFFRGALAVSPELRYRDAETFRRALDAVFPAFAAEEKTSPRPIDLSQIVDINELGDVVTNTVGKQAPDPTESFDAPSPVRTRTAAFDELAVQADIAERLEGGIDPVGQTVVDTRPSRPTAPTVPGTPAALEATIADPARRRAPPPEPDPADAPTLEQRSPISPTRTVRRAVPAPEKDLRPSTEQVAPYALSPAAPVPRRRRPGETLDVRTPRSDVRKHLTAVGGIVLAVVVGVAIASMRGDTEGGADPGGGVAAQTGGGPSTAVEAGPDGIRWVALNAGSFGMGSSGGDPDEEPIHRVKVQSFRITASEVTLSQYRACVRRGGCEEPEAHAASGWRRTCVWGRADGDDAPINCVTWQRAVTYCEWLGARLPSEAEWEYAARAGGLIQTYPWGDGQADCTRAIMGDPAGLGACGGQRPQPVCSRPAGNTAQGLCDMAGNVAEWVADAYNPRAYAGELEAGPDLKRVIRGGNFTQTAHEMRVADRAAVAPSLAVGALGFRCVK